MNKTMRLVFIFSFLISISFAQDYRTIQIETLEEAIVPGEEIYVNVNYINGENNSGLSSLEFTIQFPTNAGIDLIDIYEIDPSTMLEYNMVNDFTVDIAFATGSPISDAQLIKLHFSGGNASAGTFIPINIIESMANEEYEPLEMVNGGFTMGNPLPSEFLLLSPNNGENIEINNDNLIDGNIEIGWEESIEGREITYIFDYFTDIETGLSFLPELVTTNTIIVPFSDAAEELQNLNLEYPGITSLMVTWDVAATNGVDTTASSNGPFSFSIDASEIYLSNKSDIVSPGKFTVHQNYPNPFNPVTNLNYHLPEDSFVRITIYDAFGNEINKLIDSKQSRGQKSVQWNSNNNQGKPVSAGVYIYRIHAGDFVDNRKMILLK